MLERNWYWGKDVQEAQSWVSKDIWEQQSAGDLIDGTRKKRMLSWGSVGFTENHTGKNRFIDRNSRKDFSICRSLMASEKPLLSGKVLSGSKGPFACQNVRELNQA